MVSQEQMKDMAMQCVQNFLDECQPVTNQDAAAALMRLCSAAGVVMFAAVGYAETVSRMKCTAGAIETQLAGVELTNKSVH